MIRLVPPDDRIRIHPQLVKRIGRDTPPTSHLHATETTREGGQSASITKTEDMREVSQ